MERGSHGRRGMLSFGHGVRADDLRGTCRVGAHDLLGRMDAAAADDQVVLASKLIGDVREGCLHLPLHAGFGEVEKRLVAEGRE